VSHLFDFFAASPRFFTGSGSLELRRREVVVRALVRASDRARFELVAAVSRRVLTVLSKQALTEIRAVDRRHAEPQDGVVRRREAGARLEGRRAVLVNAVFALRAASVVRAIPRAVVLRAASELPEARRAGRGVTVVVLDAFSGATRKTQALVAAVAQVSGKRGSAFAGPQVLVRGVHASARGSQGLRLRRDFGQVHVDARPVVIDLDVKGVA